MDERPGNGSDQHVDESTIHSVAGEPPIGANGSSTGGATGSTDDHAHAGAKDDDEIRNPPKVGDDDTNGVKIKKIFKSTRRFVIYEADNEVRYRLPENPEIGRKLCQRVADLGGLRASIDDLRAEDCLSTNEKERAARELAWALALRFEEGENNPPSEDPKKILTQVDGRLRSLVKSHYRKKYVFANLAAFIVIEAILISIAVALEVLQLSQWHLPILHHYAIYAAFGALGAFLSVITGIRSINFDLNLKPWEYAFAGATRISIGVIGALVVALALDSRLIDPTFGVGPHPSAGPGYLARHIALYLMFAFVGGFSETLVPNLLRRAEQATEGSDTPKASDAPIVRPANS